jgi:hypothetical protein
MRILKAETKSLADDDVNAKADAQHERQPLTKSDDVRPTNVDPVERVRDK